MWEPAAVPALVAEATKKSDVVWLSSGAGPATAAWHVWHEAAAYTLTGPGEQPLPGVLGSSTCAVTVRSKSTGGRIVTWEAAVDVVAPHTLEWDAVVAVLKVKRLNLPDVAGAADRWAQQCVVVRLAPTGRILEAGASLPDASGAAPPRPTPATTGGAAQPVDHPT